jgi:putative cardiolipin synthase
MRPAHPVRWLWTWLMVLLAVAAFTGCATPLPKVPRSVSTSMPAKADSPLTQLAAAAAIPNDKSGYWPLIQGGHALDARLTLIRQARHSLDLQYYLLSDDGVGRTVLRELRNAAQRGVRVRLMVDDFYSQDIEAGLQALRTYPNVEVRLFNPFFSGRESGSGRLFSLLANFRRLNHRMHNKLFIADGALAIVGGRNLADEYYGRNAKANFLDLDLLVAGEAIGQLAKSFDVYWNSEQVFPIEAVATPLAPVPELQAQLAARVDDPATTPPIDPETDADMLGEPPLNKALAAGRQRFVVANAVVVADPPAKADTTGDPLPYTETLSFRVLDTLNKATSEVVIVSPYFVPRRFGVDKIRAERERGIKFTVVTNSIGTNDVPLVGAGYSQYREELVRMGVRILEVSVRQVEDDASLKKIFRSTRGGLHSKLAIVDNHILMVGSLNMDPRSAYSNTEIGIGIDSAELIQLIRGQFAADSFPGAYEVQLKPDGSGLQWVGHDAQGRVVLADDPDSSLLQRIGLWLQFLLVPEDML